MRFGKTSGRTKLKAGELRRSQVITGAGPGAVVDMANESVIMAGTDYWKHHEYEEFRITEENLQKYLGVDYFVTPSLKKADSKNDFELPAFRFPKWMFCPGCRRLAHEKVFGFPGHPRCRKCSRELIPSRFVIACEKGHLDDFPYEWWVHAGQEKTCSGQPELYFKTSEGSSGLESVMISCKTCGNSRTMAESFSSSTRFKCWGKRPWVNSTDPVECTSQARTLQRGATNLYFSINASALSIPPWSKTVQLELGKKWGVLKALINDKNTFITVVKAHQLDKKCSISAELIYEQALLKHTHEDNNDTKTWQNILEDEYRAFTNGESDPDGEFKIRSEEVPSVLNGLIDQVILASKLREVMALRGFRRIDPNFNDNDPDSFNRLSREFLNWLPGMELKGEGIFIALNEAKVREWEDKYGDRYDLMKKRMATSMYKRENFSPRYVLLHTLSHLIIKQLVVQCGYSTASIKERIYSSFVTEESHLNMAGILIYTATNDSEGSLGGLVRQGEVDRFQEAFFQMLETAGWCSSDPLCIQSMGQGVDSLNYASCHSCTLLPETSCESRNCYLDRASIVGALDKPSLGFFSSVFSLSSEGVISNGQNDSKQLQR